MTLPHVRIRDARLAYSQRCVFAKLNLDLPPARWIALLGPSGIGKSSLLRMIAGLTTSEETVEGSIQVDNRLPLPQQVAYMAQTDLLLPWLTVLSNATLGLTLRKSSPHDHAEQINKAKLRLKQVGLSNEMHLFPSQLSGGMRQRVALVRTLMENKPIVLMDEPFSALDAITRYQLQALAAQLLRGKTVLFITHDPSEALRLAHEIYIMQGQPASIKWVASLTTETPREHTDPNVLALQQPLFHELAQATGAIS